MAIEYDNNGKIIFEGLYLNNLVFNEKELDIWLRLKKK